MPKYTEDCKRKYVRGKDVEYVKCVLSGIKKYEDDRKVLRRAMKALLEISEKQGSIQTKVKESGFLER